LVIFVTKLWSSLDANSTLASNFYQYTKLAQIAMIHVLGSVEDECCFFSLGILKGQGAQSIGRQFINCSWHKGAVGLLLEHFSGL